MFPSVSNASGSVFPSSSNTDSALSYPFPLFTNPVISDSAISALENSGSASDMLIPAPKIHYIQLSPLMMHQIYLLYLLILCLFQELKSPFHIHHQLLIPPLLIHIQ
ncbi:hypothetical protein AAHE18_05G025800 [Arachis hypogaea]